MCSFRMPLTIHHCIALYCVAPSLLLPCRFARLPSWYYGLEKIRRSFGAASSGIKSIPNFIEILLLVLELDSTDRWTLSVLYVFILCTLCREYIKKGVEVGKR
jgi:hypothetical protein